MCTGQPINNLPGHFATADTLLMEGANYAVYADVPTGILIVPRKATPLRKRVLGNSPVTHCPRGVIWAGLLRDTDPIALPDGRKLHVKSDCGVMVVALEEESHV